MKRPDCLPDLPEGYAWRHHLQRGQWEIVASPLGPAIAFVTDEFLRDVVPAARDSVLQRMVENLR